MMAKFWAWVLFFSLGFHSFFFLLKFVEIVTAVDVDVAVAVVVAVVGFRVFKERWFFFLVFGKEKYWIAIWLYYKSRKSMKMRIMVGLIKICVNMDEEKSREKQGKTKGRGRGNKKKKKQKKKGEKSQLTLGQWMGPTNS